MDATNPRPNSIGHHPTPTAIVLATRPQESLRVEAQHVRLSSNRWVFPESEGKGHFGRVVGREGVIKLEGFRNHHGEYTLSQCCTGQVC